MPIYDQPWGYSKLATYEECPQKFKFQYINKLPQPSSPAMERGGRMHASCEAYLNGWDQTIDPEISSMKDALDELKKHKPFTELAWGFDKSWNLLPNWFHADTWLRAKADAYYQEDSLLTIIDFKSGKFKVPPEAQIELYAICGLAVCPDVEVVKTEYWFLDTGEILAKEYTKAHLLVLREKYTTVPLYTDETFAPQPSRSCSYCPYSRSKGGICDAG